MSKTSANTGKCSGARGRAGGGVGALARTLALIALTLALRPSAALAAPSPSLSSPPGASLDPQSEAWDGLSQLVALAHGEFGQAQVIVTQRLDLGTLARQDALLVVHPTRPLDTDELLSFMHAGGRIALLDDYGSGDAFEADLGIKRVPLPSKPAAMLRENPAFAIAEQAASHPATRDVSRVVTNHATGLEDPTLSPLLVVHGDGEPDVFVGLAGAIGQGRLLVVGDSSVAINQMLRYPGNRELAADVLRYLLEDDAWGKRGGKVYLLVGGFETTGAYGTDSSFLGALHAAWRTLAEGVDSVRAGGLPPAAAYTLALATSLFVLGWAVRRAGRLHRPLTPRYARSTPVAEQGGIAGYAAEAGRPRAPRALALAELRLAVEEDIATRLGLPRAPAPEALAAKARAAGLLDSEDAADLESLLTTLGRLQTAAPSPVRSAADRLRYAEIAGLAERARRLLARAAAPGPRDTVETSQ
ncbi:MAG: DUF4350 domain-containing protein [Polyangiaceae bacterium]